MELGDIEHPKETISECQHHLDLLRGLRDLAAWDLLCRYFDDSATHVERAILGTPTRPELTYEQEFRKGQATTLRTIRHYLDEYCEYLEGKIQQIMTLMKTEEEQEEESARRDRTFDYRVTGDYSGEPEPEPEPVTVP